MKQTGIMFQPWKVQRILEWDWSAGNMQTRRIMKPQPCAHPLRAQHPEFWTHSKFQEEVWYDVESMAIGIMESETFLCPYGYAYGDGTGDLLYVKETFQAQNTAGKWWHEIPRDERSLWNWAWTNKVQPAYDNIPPRWCSGRFMPKAAARIWLELVSVRVERVKDITWHDIHAEGCPPEHHADNCNGMTHAMYGWWEHLWDSINQKRGFGWDTNPWVWVLEYRLLRGKINA